MSRTKDHFLYENTIEETIKSLADSFRSSSTSQLDAQVLLSHVMQKSKAWLLAHKEIELTTDQQISLANLASQVKEGVPLPYVIGHWAFYGLDFLVTPDVLIPRPETEQIVEYAHIWLMDHPGRRRALDLGTGTGCIAISLASLLPDLEIIATDVSKDALTVAQTNAIRHQVERRINFFLADLLNPDPSSTVKISPPIDIITANLPYIPTATLKKLDVCQHEPTQALDGGHDGLNLIRRFLKMSGPYLSPGGCMLLEIEEKQGQSVIKLAKENFPGANIMVHPDLSGKDRLLKIIT